MDPFLPITDIYAREILDSRGNPTVEVEMVAGNHSHGLAKTPSGLSTGTYEARELRDNEQRYHGMGVKKAVSAINDEIVRELIDSNIFGQKAIDNLLYKLDNDDTNPKFGSNARLGVSMAAARCAANAAGIPLYRYLGGVRKYELPIPAMNLINGARHAENGLTFQEFMILPRQEGAFAERLRCGVEIYHTLRGMLEQDGKAISVGDEGGFAPRLKDAKEALGYLVSAIEKTGYEPGTEVALAIDAAANGFYNLDAGLYRLSEDGRMLSAESLVDYYEELCEKFPVYSIEDGLWEGDWSGWQKLTKRLGDKIQIVGDALFATDIRRLEKGIAEGCANAVLIKPNQRGTLSETIETIQLAQRSGYDTIVSHRSGETEDTFIADLAVAFGCMQLKAGAPCRSERVAKYNRLLKIEEELQKDYLC